jgi:hypothetical protein
VYAAVLSVVIPEVWQRSRYAQRASRDGKALRVTTKHGTVPKFQVVPKIE